jgi:hypothetical protein
MDQAQLEPNRSSKGKEYHFSESKFVTSVVITSSKNFQAAGVPK